MKSIVNAPSLDLIRCWEPLGGAWEGPTHVYPVKSSDGGYGGKPDAGQRSSPSSQMRGPASERSTFSASGRGMSGNAAQLRVAPGGALAAQSPWMQSATNMSTWAFSAAHAFKTLSGLTAAARAVPIVWAGAIALGPVTLGLLTATLLFSKEAGRGSTLPLQGRMSQKEVGPLMHASVPTSEPPGPRIETVPDETDRRKTYFSPNARPFRLPGFFEGLAIPGFSAVEPVRALNEPFGGEPLVQDRKASGGFQSWVPQIEDFFHFSKDEMNDRGDQGLIRAPERDTHPWLMPHDLEWIRGAAHNGWGTQRARAEHIGGLLLNMPDQAKMEALRYARYLEREPMGKRWFSYRIGDRNAYNYLNTLVHRTGGQLSELDGWLKDVLLEGEKPSQLLDHLISNPVSWAQARTYLKPIVAPNIKQWNSRNLAVIERIALGQTEAHIAQSMPMELDHVRVQVYKLIDKAGGYSRRDVEVRYKGGIVQLASDALTRMRASEIEPGRLNQLTLYQSNLLLELLSGRSNESIAKTRGLKPNSYRSEISKIRQQLGVSNDVNLATLATLGEGALIRDLRARVPTEQEVLQALDETPIEVLEDLLARLSGVPVSEVAALRQLSHLAVRKNFQDLAQRLKGRVLDISELMRPAFKEDESAVDFLRRVLETKRV